MTIRTTSIATPTAHVVGPGKLKVVNGRLSFTTGEGTPLRLDPEQLETVLCYGAVGATDEALQVLFQHDVHVAWMSPNGHRCRGRLVGFGDNGTTLRMMQHQALSDPAVKLNLARRAVSGKIDSQMLGARHHQRHGVREAAGTIQRLQDRLRQCNTCTDLDVLRGVEGAATLAWFDLLGKVLVAPWRFDQRTRRPPTDPVNALLSLGYTLLLNRILARCQAAGLEVNLGALHEYRPGRPSLPCDLIEPHRVGVVDRWVVELCNQMRIKPDDFVTQDGGVRLKPERFGTVLGWWEERWASQQFDKLVEQTVEAFMKGIRDAAQ